MLLLTNTKLLHRQMHKGHQPHIHPVTFHATCSGCPTKEQHCATAHNSPHSTRHRCCCLEDFVNPILSSSTSAPHNHSSAAATHLQLLLLQSLLVRQELQLAALEPVVARCADGVVLGLFCVAFWAVPVVLTISHHKLQLAALTEGKRWGREGEGHRV